MGAREEEAQRFLEQVRAQYEAILGAPPSPHRDPVELVGVMDQILRRVADLLAPDMDAWFVPEGLNEHQYIAPLGTALSPDHDFVRSAFSLMQREIERTLALEFKRLDLESTRPLIGHVRTGQLNAVSLMVPGNAGAYLVLIEDHLPLFTVALMTLVASAINPPEIDDADGVYINVPLSDEWMSRNPDVARQFTNIVIDYAITGHINPASVSLPTRNPDGVTGLVDTLITYMWSFVLGHEYGHILRGHLRKVGTSTVVLADADIKTLAYSWRQELDADYFGMNLVHDTYVTRGGDNPIQVQAGINLYFELMDVMNRAVAVLHAGDETALQIGSHPPWSLRKQRFFDLMLQEMERHAPTEIDRARENWQRTDALAEFVRLMWEHARPVLLHLHRDGIRPATMWRTVHKESGDSMAGTP